MPDMIAFAPSPEAGKIHLHQHVAGIEHSLYRILLAIPDLGDRLGWNNYLADLLSQTERLNARFQRFLDLALKTRVAVDDVPLHVRVRIFRRGRSRCFLRVAGRVDVLFCHLPTKLSGVSYRMRCNTQLTALPIT